MQNSHIEWTDHTFNPWHGCFKVSPGCTHCYAEVLSRRFGRAIWGPPATTPRRTMSDNYWAQPIKWNKAAEQAGTRARVFCASMADVFEDHPQVSDARRRLFELIDQTPSLDWQLLTKRPENILGMLDDWAINFPPNIWLGTSVENQEQADKRIPELLKTPARIRFLSCEPLLSGLDIRWALHYPACPQHPGEIAAGWGHMDCDCRPFQRENKTGIEWIIVGGESGHGARPMNPQWARDLRSQAQAAGVAFFFKQWGEHAPINGDTPMPAGDAPRLMRGVRRDGTVLSGNDTMDQADAWMWRAGKGRAGRLLDGREWNEMP